MVSNSEEICQSIAAELGTNKGEWFLDPDMGIRFERFNGKNPSPEEMADEIREALHREPRVDTVEDVIVKQDKVKRQQTIEFVVTTTRGNQLRSEVSVDA